MSLYYAVVGPYSGIYSSLKIAVRQAESSYPPGKCIAFKFRAEAEAYLHQHPWISKEEKLQIPSFTIDYNSSKQREIQKPQGSALKVVAGECSHTDSESLELPSTFHVMKRGSLSPVSLKRKLNLHVNSSSDRQDYKRFKPRLNSAFDQPQLKYRKHVDIHDNAILLTFKGRNQYTLRFLTRRQLFETLIYPKTIHLHAAINCERIRTDSRKIKLNLSICGFSVIATYQNTRLTTYSDMISDPVSSKAPGIFDHESEINYELYAIYILLHNFQFLLDSYRELLFLQHANPSSENKANIVIRISSSMLVRIISDGWSSRSCTYQYMSLVNSTLLHTVISLLQRHHKCLTIRIVNIPEQSLSYWDLFARRSARVVRQEEHRRIHDIYMKFHNRGFKKR